MTNKLSIEKVLRTEPYLHKVHPRAPAAGTPPEAQFYPGAAAPEWMLISGVVSPDEWFATIPNKVRVPLELVQNAIEDLLEYIEPIYLERRKPSPEETKQIDNLVEYIKQNYIAAKRTCQYMSADDMEACERYLNELKVESNLEEIKRILQERV